MKKASISEAKNNFSALIDRVRQGSSVLIVDRERPVARLEPIVIEDAPDDNGRLTRLVRDGLLNPARGPVPKSLFSTPPPRPKPGTSAVRALVDERRSGR